jgi:hypothetical protein
VGERPSLKEPAVGRFNAFEDEHREAQRDLPIRRGAGDLGGFGGCCGCHGVLLGRLGRAERVVGDVTCERDPQPVEHHRSRIGEG